MPPYNGMLFVQNILACNMCMQKHSNIIICNHTLGICMLLCMDANIFVLTTILTPSWKFSLCCKPPKCSVVCTVHYILYATCMQQHSCWQYIPSNILGAYMLPDNFACMIMSIKSLLSCRMWSRDNAISA